MSNVTFSIVCGLVVLLTLGVSNAMIKKITENIGINQFLFFRGVTVVSLLTTIFFVNLKTHTFGFELNTLQFLLAFTLATLGTVALKFLYRAYSYTKVGLASPITVFNVVVAITLSMIFLNLKLNISQLLGIGIIILSILSIRFDFKLLNKTLNDRDIKGVNLALLSTLFMGTYFFLIQLPTKILGPILTPLASETNGIFVGGIYMLKNKEPLRFPHKKALLQALLACVLLTVAATTLYLGIQKGNIAIVLALYSSNPVVTTIYGAIVYKEKLHAKQYFAVAFLVIGVIILRVFS